MNMRILGTGSSLPANVITNNDIEKLVDTSDEWIKERTGIEKRHVSSGETVADLAYEASKKALDSAEKEAKDVELIIVATCSPENILPCVACQVQDRIGAKAAVAFDLNAACSGFMFALNTAYSYISSGIYKNALVVGAEVLSKIVDYSDRNTCILFGDGAGAVYVEATNDNIMYDFVQHSDGSKGEYLSCLVRPLKNPIVDCDDMPGFVTMDGKEIFRFAVGTIPTCIEEAVTKAGIKTEDVDLFFLHQANYRILLSIAKRLGVDMSRVPTNVSMVGNMSSASIPVILDECNRNGIIKRGMKLVLSGFGAGLTYGATVMTW